MRTEHQTTPEEEAYERLVEENWESLSEMARTVLREAEAAAYTAYMVRSYCFQWDIDYDEAMEEMRLAAAALNARECELLARIWRAASAAAASIDADDLETIAGYGVYSANLHRYYRLVSAMVEQIQQGEEG